MAGVRSWDRGGPRPVLALHCSLAHSGAWAGLAAGLSGVTVTAPDLPGHGNAPDWDGRQDLHRLATDQAAATVDALAGAGGVDLIGHSFGATVALRLALQTPHRFRSLTLIEPVLFAAVHAGGWPGWPGFLAEGQAMRALLASGDRDAATRRFLAEWGDGAPFDTLPDRLRRYMTDRIHLIPAQDDALIADAAGILAPERLEDARLPVLLIDGSKSPPVMAAIMDELARRLPAAHCATVPGAGHMVPISHAGQVAQEVMAHLARSPAVTA